MKTNNYFFKTILFSALSLISFSALHSQTARLQVIHNSADAAAASVDVYLNGTLLLDDFTFRTASPFIDAPAGQPLEIAIAPATSTSVTDSIPGLVFSGIVLTDQETYVVVANGTVSATGYAPAQPFNLDVFAGAKEQASTAGNTDVLVYHGSTDAPTVDVDEATAGNLVDDISYSEFAGYLPLATADYQLQIKDAAGVTTVASFDAPLATLNLQDSALVVLASGFLDPSQNSNGAAFGLWVALPGGGNLIELPTPTTSLTSVKAIDFDLYPNPTQDYVYVKSSEPIDEIRIFDAQSRLVQHIVNSATNQVIDLKDLNTGQYMIQVRQGLTQSNKVLFKN